MALILEDGTSKTDAESFAAATDLVAYAVKFGAKIPPKTPDQEALLRRSFVAMFTMHWKGRPTSHLQAGAFPRRHVVVDGVYLATNLIPARVFYGQMALAVEIYADDLSPPELRVGPAVMKRVEGAVTIEYAKLIDVNGGKVLPAAPGRPSRAQFADYLQARGLFAIRA